MRAIILISILISSTLSAERVFFAFDNGLTDIKAPEGQAALLNKLGYSGICTRPRSASPELMAAFDRQGLRIVSSYVVLEAGAAPPDSLEEHFKLIKKHQPVIWLGITKAKGMGDQHAALSIRKVVDLATKHGLKTSLYPHIGYHTDTVKSCERIYPFVKRPKLGLSFSLCHFLAQNPEDQLEATLKRIAPKLNMIQINGADQIEQPKPDWKKLIQPLGSGSFDVGRVIKILDEIDYQGPVNLQCYQLPGPAHHHLADSMKAWKKLQSTPAQ